GYELGGRRFESFRARHIKCNWANNLAVVGLFVWPALCPSCAHRVPTPIQSAARTLCPNGKNRSFSLVVSPIARLALPARTRRAPDEGDPQASSVIAWRVQVPGRESPKIAESGAEPSPFSRR